MKMQDFIKVGIRADCIDEALAGFKAASQDSRFKSIAPHQLIRDIVADPKGFIADRHFSALAHRLMEKVPAPPPEKPPIGYTQWGKDIDAQSIKQMQAACALPVAVAGALMPDAHVGYGLPIGGVLACENAVIPYAVGVDIACRMKLSVVDIPVETLEKELQSTGGRLADAIQKGTCFGVGMSWKQRHEHPVLDMDWSVSPITRQLKDRAWSQLGTSGSGNHFVEIGILTLMPPNDGEGVLFGALPDAENDPTSVRVLDRGRYLAILSHSGSRGTGAAVCSEYSRLAMSKLSKRYGDRFGQLAWLDLDTQEGQEYWQAMNLMGEYASANHACIHKTVAKLLGAERIAGVENHHNFAWKEVHNGKELIVHRKGATPAGAGVLGVIPGSMADPCYVVVGKGNAASLNSASHGAGRKMSRGEARRQFNWPEWEAILKQRGVRLLSAGLDEVPGAYKDIREVMAAQTDLVEVVAQFDPKIVKMSDDGKSED